MQNITKKSDTELEISTTVVTSVSFSSLKERAASLQEELDTINGQIAEAEKLGIVAIDAFGLAIN